MARKLLKNVLASSYGIAHYFMNAGGGEDFDVKRILGDYYSGSVLFEENGESVFASNRDVGNFAAGVVAGKSMFPNELLMYGFGTYQSIGSDSKWELAGIIVWDFLMGGEGMHMSNRDGKYNGEYQLSGKGIELGMEYADQY